MRGMRGDDSDIRCLKNLQVVETSRSGRAKALVQTDRGVSGKCLDVICLGLFLAGSL